MNRYYCTFGSDPLFPFGQDQYVIVEAPNLNAAHRLFQIVHPNPRPGSENITNCAFVETEERFNEYRDKFYKDVEPSEIISINVERK